MKNAVPASTGKDVEKISRLIEKEFAVDKNNSMNKANAMDIDRVGYLSVHYVVQFRSSRIKLLEYDAFDGLRFEIQVRTLLQHAWAAIEHDRNYKFSGELPTEIKRRFYLLAGTLELVDAEFDQLSTAIDKYAQNVKRDVKAKNLDMPINSTSLKEYLSAYPLPIANELNFKGHDKEIIKELEDFGIHKLEDLDDMLTDEKVTSFLRARRSETYLGALRHIMILKDPKKYFQDAWNSHWGVIDDGTYKTLAELNPQVEAILPKYVRHY